MVDLEKNIQNSLYDRVYLIYDSKLQQFSHPLVMKESEHVNVFKQLVNNVTSIYYGHEEDYILYDFGVFNNSSGYFEYEPIKSLGSLAIFIDDKVRNVQVCIQTLNYLPNGYFKMPKEMQENIQAKIDESVKSYVSQFIDSETIMSQSMSSTNENPLT